MNYCLGGTSAWRPFADGRPILPSKPVTEPTSLTVSAACSTGRSQPGSTSVSASFRISGGYEVDRPQLPTMLRPRILLRRVTRRSPRYPPVWPVRSAGLGLPPWSSRSSLTSSTACIASSGLATWVRWVPSPPRPGCDRIPSHFVRRGMDRTLTAVSEQTPKAVMNGSAS